MAQGFIPQSQSGLLDTSTIATSQTVAEALGTSWQSILSPFQRMYDAAEQRGYQARILSSDGVIGIYKETSLMLRVKVGAHRLQPGCWEEHVAKLMVQVQLLDELSGLYPDVEVIDEEKLLGRLRAILAIEDSTPISMHLNSFPGATQCLIAVNGQFVASVVFNPIHKFLLEFRLDAIPLLSVESLEETEHVLDAIELPIARPAIGADAYAAVLRVARHNPLRTLVIVDSAVGFGSMLRRGILRLLPHLVDCGFDTLRIDHPEEDEETLREALEQGELLRYFLEHPLAQSAPERIAERLNPEWTALLSAAHFQGMRICGGAADVYRQPTTNLKTAAKQIIWYPHERSSVAAELVTFLTAQSDPAATHCIIAAELRMPGSESETGAVFVGPQFVSLGAASTEQLGLVQTEFLGISEDTCSLFLSNEKSASDKGSSVT
jgi:hypothetical protein